jgi:enterobactin synthetase component D
MQSSVLPFHARECRVVLNDLTASETAFIPLPPELLSAVPKRQAQFRAGRYCAMLAIQALHGGSMMLIGRDASGAPLWPDGVVGSITHTDDVAAAAVASAADVLSLGIDTERVISESQARDLNGTVAWPAELAHARTAGMTRLEAMTLVFSAKESVFKCLHPRVRRTFDFQDVRLVNVDAAAGTFVVRVVKTLSEEFPSGTRLQGQFSLDGLWVHTGMCLTARSLQ